MGANESSEASGDAAEIDEECEIFRDLLEEDGCESGWHTEQKTETGDQSIIFAPGTRFSDEKKVLEDSGMVVKRGKRAARQGSERVSVLTTDDGQLLLTEEGRPLAEPPILNYDLFVREAVPSPGKLKLMFGNDVEALTAFRDHETEENLLRAYKSALRYPTNLNYWYDEPKISDAGCLVLERRKAVDEKYGRFDESLSGELWNELYDLETEIDAARETMSPLLKWEAEYLDNDDENGNTTSLQQLLERGENPFELHDTAQSAAEGKYTYIFDALSRRPMHDLDTWLFFQRAKGKMKSIPVYEVSYQFAHALHRKFSAYLYGGEAAYAAFRDFVAERQTAAGGLSLPDDPGDFGRTTQRPQYKLILAFWDEVVFPSTGDETENQEWYKGIDLHS